MVVKNKTKSNKIKRYLFLSIFLFSILLFSIFTLTKQVNAQTGNFFCAEKTQSGAWCQNVPEEEINKDYKWSPTSCDQTSYCKLGTCVNSLEGICSPNVPQRVCQANNGIWSEKEPGEISQCQLGCCFIGDGASFVTQTRCTRLSSLYGLDINFKPNIQNELQCLASAFPKEKGACVFDDGFSRKCKLLTREKCQEQEAKSGQDTDVEFHEGLLCSAEILETECSGIPSNPRTTLIKGKDEVYFLDSCGNLANIYDSSKVNDQNYWTYIKSKSESCNPDESNSGSKTCGNCNYLLGSIGKAYKRGSLQTPKKPLYGDYVCADLSCTYHGKKYQHGESWCATNAKSGNENNPGSENYRLVCNNGEVIVEECSAFRQEICVEEVDKEIDYSFSMCKANAWEDCYFIDNKEDCENEEVRDCKWVVTKRIDKKGIRSGVGSILREDNGKPYVVNENGKLVMRKDDDKRPEAACVPKNAPGFDFYGNDSSEIKETESICAYASANCIVKFEKSLLGSWKCKENCECAGLKKDDSSPMSKEDLYRWATERNKLCIALGDCGSKPNFIGKDGKWNIKDMVNY